MGINMPIPNTSNIAFSIDNRMITKKLIFKLIGSLENIKVNEFMGLNIYFSNFINLILTLTI